MKKNYSAPRLTVHGSLKKITAQKKTPGAADAQGSAILQGGVG